MVAPLRRVACFLWIHRANPFTIWTNQHRQHVHAHARAHSLLPLAATLTTTLLSTSTSTPFHGRDVTTHSSPLAATKTKPMSSSEPSNNDEIETGFLNAKDAYDLDQELFTSGSYTLDQLMELAGLAVAEAVYAVSPPRHDRDEKKKRVLLVCGPGNNGGDGLVAARHLVMFGYEAVVVYPKRSSREKHYTRLVQQCEQLNISILDTMPPSQSEPPFDVVVDAIFGFSFSGGAPREPFASAISDMVQMQQRNAVDGTANGKTIVISVDVPSGWNVDGSEGEADEEKGWYPDVLVSLTAPKLCARGFRGRHFVGGRFLPPDLADKYGIRMPPYPGVSQVMEITPSRERNVSADAKENDYDWRKEYAEYCAEKEAKDFQRDGTAQSDGATTTIRLEGKSSDGNNSKDEDDWGQQYYDYLAEKEAKLKQVEEEEKSRGQRKTEDDDWGTQYYQYLAEKEAKLKQAEEEK